MLGNHVRDAFACGDATSRSNRVSALDIGEVFSSTSVNALTLRSRAYRAGIYDHPRTHGRRRKTVSLRRGVFYHTWWLGVGERAGKVCIMYDKVDRRGIAIPGRYGVRPHSTVSVISVILFDESTLSTRDVIEPRSLRPLPSVPRFELCILVPMRERAISRVEKLNK